MSLPCSSAAQPSRAALQDRQELYCSQLSSLLQKLLQEELHTTTQFAIRLSQKYEARRGEARRGEVRSGGSISLCASVSQDIS